MNKRGNGFLWNSDFVSHTDALDLAASHQIVCAILADLENLCELVNRKNKGKLLISRVFHFLTSLLRIILVIFATHPDAGMLKVLSNIPARLLVMPLMRTSFSHSVMLAHSRSNVGLLSALPHYAGGLLS